MTLLRQTSRLLDDEHRANLELLGRAERAFTRPRAGEVPPLAAQLAHTVGDEFTRHFAFEELQLFPRMTDAGDGDLAALLAEEHETIRAVAAELLPLLRAAAASALDERGAAALARLTAELVERVVVHVQKETMALLPLLDELLDDDTDRELAAAYACA